MNLTLITLVVGLLPGPISSATTLGFESFRPDGIPTTWITNEHAAPGGRAPAPSRADPDIVLFTDDGGYGLHPTVNLDLFARETLNLDVEPPWKKARKDPDAGKSAEDRTDNAMVVPEVGSPLIGTLGLILLMKRRR